jgi:hypothetical protein
MPAFTISDAARHCGVDRRTLQRAIQSGRLALTADHRLTTEALAQAGYLPAAPQSHTAGMPHYDAAGLPQSPCDTAALYAAVTPQPMPHLCRRRRRRLTPHLCRRQCDMPRRRRRLTKQQRPCRWRPSRPTFSALRRPRCSTTSSVWRT